MCKEDYFCVPDGFIVFISGVPGVGKTTTSYELLKKCNGGHITNWAQVLNQLTVNSLFEERIGKYLR